MLSLLTISGTASNTKLTSSLCGSNTFSCTASDARAPPSSAQAPLLRSEAASPPTAVLLLMLQLRRIVRHRAALRDHSLVVPEILLLSRIIDSSCFFRSSPTCRSENWRFLSMRRSSPILLSVQSPETVGRELVCILKTLTSIFQCGENLRRSEENQPNPTGPCKGGHRKVSEEAAAANAGV
jgi:hypothetical protein